MGKTLQKIYTFFLYGHVLYTLYHEEEEETNYEETMWNF